MSSVTSGTGFPAGGGKQGRREALGQERGGGEGTAGPLGQPKERRDQDSPQSAAFGDEPVQAPGPGKDPSEVSRRM